MAVKSKFPKLQAKATPFHGYRLTLGKLVVEYSGIQMLHRLSAQPPDAFLHVRWDGPKSTVGIDQNGDECLRHQRASPTPVDPERSNTLEPNRVRESRRDVDHFHKRAKLAPMLWRMGS
jgi:hypothetical protein